MQYDSESNVLKMVSKRDSSDTGWSQIPQAGSLISSIASILQRIIFYDKRNVSRYVAATCALLAVVARVPAAPLMEEGFDYPAGTALAIHPPWAGSSGSSVGVVSGNLVFAELADTAAHGNLLHIGGGTSRNVYRNFSSSPVAAAPGVAVYFSALIDCTLLPTNTQFIASLLRSGTTSPHQPDDPLDLYVTTGPGGYRLSITSSGSDRATASAVLSSNTTHLIVMKYTFGAGAFASIYIDPNPGGSEPASPNAQTDQDDDGTGATGASNLQVILFHAPNLATQGSLNFDGLRIGTNWADVTPALKSLSVSGPQDQAVCYGSGASFSVLAAGTPPYSYQWRTNGVILPDAISSVLALDHPTTEDSLNGFDVVVSDSFGSVTSRVARLGFSTNAVAILTPPASQVVTPAVSNVTFSVTVTGDAPVSFQWRTNGVAIGGATNPTYTLNNPTLAGETTAFDVVAANPCGSVTSSPPVFALFPHAFYAAHDAGPGLFAGEILDLINTSGLPLKVWSSPALDQPITSWNFEGDMTEAPLNDGSGNSQYSLNVVPAASPVYYIVGTAVTWPYLMPIPITWLTTSDYVNFSLSSTNTVADASGLLGLPLPPRINQNPASQTVWLGTNVQFAVSASGSNPLSYQWFFNTNVAVAGGTNSSLTIPQVTAPKTGSYFVVATNSFGSVTSLVASLAVFPQPVLQASKSDSGVQLTGIGIPGSVLWLMVATNLTPPVAWQSVATNVSDAAGLIQFTDGSTGGSSQKFYRLAAP